MARLVNRDSITSGEALASGQTLRLGSFIMGARPAVKTEAVRIIAKNCLLVGPEYSDKMNPADVLALNELLDRTAALGVATDYDRIGLKPDQRKIRSPAITHHVAIMEEQADDESFPTLRTKYVRISELGEPDTHLPEDTSCPSNIESGIEPKNSPDAPELGLVASEIL